MHNKLRLHAVRKKEMNLIFAAAKCKMQNIYSPHYKVSVCRVKEHVMVSDHTCMAQALSQESHVMSKKVACNYYIHALQVYYLEHLCFTQGIVACLDVLALSLLQH
jgi:hypothetical protein